MLTAAIYEYVGPESNPPQEQLVLTREDLLWLGRAYVGEHGDYNLVHFPVFVWCMLNRFFLHPGAKHWKSFTFMLRRFSQPINPRWMRGGDLAEKHAGSRMCTKGRLDRREKISAMSWGRLPVALRRLLVDLLRGIIAPSFEGMSAKNRYSNFAATTKRLKHRYPYGYNIGGNWYFEGRSLRKGVVVVNHWAE